MPIPPGATHDDILLHHAATHTTPASSLPGLNGGTTDTSHRQMVDDSPSLANRVISATSAQFARRPGVDVGTVSPEESRTNKTINSKVYRGAGIVAAAAAPGTMAFDAAPEILAEAKHVLSSANTVLSNESN